MPVELNASGAATELHADDQFAVWKAEGLLHGERLKSYLSVWYGGGWNTIAEHGDGAFHIVLEDQLVYWANDQGIYRCWAGGCREGEPTRILVAEEGVNLRQATLAVSGDTLIWATTGPDDELEIRSCPISSCQDEQQVIYAEPNPTINKILLTDGTYLVFDRDPPDHLTPISLDSCELADCEASHQVLTPSIHPIDRTAALREGRVAWQEIQTLFTCELPDCEPEVVAEGTNDPAHSIQIDDTTIRTVGPGELGILAYPLDGGEPWLELPDTQLMRFVVVDEFVVYYNNGVFKQVR